MDRMRLNRFKSWANRVGAEIETETEETEFGEKHTVRAVFSRHEERYIPGEGYIRRPKVYVETNGYCDEFRVEGGDILDVTVETYTDPGQKDYEKETLDSTGTVGGETHFNSIGEELQVIETASDGWRRTITVEP